MCSWQINDDDDDDDDDDRGFTFNFSTRVWLSNFISFPKMNILHLKRRRGKSMRQLIDSALPSVEVYSYPSQL